MGTASNFSIDKFTAKLADGGALASLFQCELTGAKGSGSTIADFKFLCKGVTFPASAIEAATITFMGRALQIPSNRAAATLTTSIYNDEGMAIRNHLENWMELINSHKTNKRDGSMKKITGSSSYTGSLKISQHKKDDSGVSKVYEFVDVWPSSTGDITLSWDTNDIQTYDVTWEYNYWKSPESSTGGATSTP